VRLVFFFFRSIWLFALSYIPNRLTFDFSYFFIIIFLLAFAVRFQAVRLRRVCFAPLPLVLGGCGSYLRRYSVFVSFLLGMGLGVEVFMNPPPPSNSYLAGGTKRR